MPANCHAWVYITCSEILAENCQWKEISFYSITDPYFNKELIRLQHGPAKFLNLFVLTLFQHAFWRVRRCYQFFCCFDVKWKVTNQRHDPRKKVDRNSDNAFQLVDLWLAKKTTFEKTNYKIQVAAKGNNLCLTRSDLLTNVFLCID